MTNHSGRATDDAVQSGAGQQKTILLVEDAPIIRRLYTSMLIASGYRVVEAPDAEFARDLLRTGFEIDLLLSIGETCLADQSADVSAHSKITSPATA